MAEQSNPFDVSELMYLFDPNRYMEQVRRLMQQYGLPSMDPQVLMEAQRRNMEAVVAANRTLLEGTEALMRHQADLMREVFEEMNRSAGQLSADEDPAQRAARQMDMVGRIYDHLSGHLREASQQVLRTQEATMTQLDARFRDSLQELRGMSASPGEGKPAGKGSTGSGASPD
ncbi:phasin family protein [Ectothiorhodospira mobilis]|jgi:hypothetical protein|uniref:Phasin protein n=1 Tax=Ectothiorhodospira mobilis TaxID=195064 RepID=A0A1I4QZA9_ECTMO|nr:phasin family protein [Ectothiorhodospira mobilis]MCG5535928.1 phasin family protein [Ectothiorhodospira mobilis]SFM45379.1 Phasin protein [Ectothiorhodospira mobilis]